MLQSLQGHIHRYHSCHQYSGVAEEGASAPAAHPVRLTTPTVNNRTTSTFIANASNERLEIRSGRIGAADWEWGLGTNTQAAGQFQNINNINWASGVAIKYTITDNADGSGTIALFDSTTNNQLATKTFPTPAAPATGLRNGNAIKVYVKTNAGLTTASTATSIQQVNGQSINAANQAAYNFAFLI